MTEQRPLPDSGEMQHQRRNQHLARRATITVGVFVVILVVLFALRWMFQE